MKKKYKVFLCVIGILLVLSLILSTSYAFFYFSTSQDGNNIASSGCFRITYSGSGDISLLDGVPMPDSKANSLTPYTFTIRNVCNYSARYSVNIETLEESSMDIGAVKYKLNNDEARLLSSATSVDSSLYINPDAKSSKSIYTSVLNANDSKHFSLRLWIGQNATVSQSAGKTFSSKVFVVSELNDLNNSNESIALFADGRTLNIRLKSLIGISDHVLEGAELNICLYEPSDTCLFSYGGGEEKSSAINSLASTNSEGLTVSAIERSYNAPSNDKEVVVLSDDDSDYEILGWFETTSGNSGKIYIFSAADYIYLNENSNYAFSGFDDLESFDLDMFKYNKVESTNYYLGYSGSDSSQSSVSLSSNISFASNASLSNMFSYSEFSNFENINYLNTSNVVDMSYMFLWSHFKTLNLSNINTQNVVDMTSMFDSTRSLTSLDLSGLNTSNVENMSHMFSNCGAADLNVSLFNTSNVTNMDSMFTNTKVSSLDLSNFNTANVTNMNSMFYGSSNLTTIYVGDNWHTASSGNGMFRFCNKLVGGSGTTYTNPNYGKNFAQVDCLPGHLGYFTYKGTLGNTSDYCTSLN